MATMEIRSLVPTLALAASLAVSACAEPAGDVTTGVAASLADFPLDKATRDAVSLPKVLKEISGLAVVDETSVLAHNDERAIVYRIDLVTLEVVSLFQLGDPALAADLEGIAILGDDLYLVDSGGVLFEVRGGVSRRGVVTDYRVIDTGIGAVCEVEGLDADYAPRALVVACKRMKDRSEAVSLYSFDVDERQASEIVSLGADLFDRALNPSGVARAFGNYVLVAGRDRMIVEITRTGEVVHAARLKKKRHPQSEGVGILPSRRRLLIADEGGLLTSYGPATPGSGQ